MQNSEELLLFLEDKKIEYEEDISMKNLTSFKIGGRVKVLVSPSEIESFAVVFKFLKKYNIPYFFLGNGSNILFKDKDFFGVAVSSKNLNKIRILENNIVECESGVNLFKLCRFLKTNSLSGMEELFGIPGSLGGAIYMNAGAYGVEIKDLLLCVCYFDEKENLVEKETKDLDFFYRYSVFQKTNNFIVSAKMKLRNGKADDIEKKMKEIFQKRVEKQPLNFPSAGSVFKRPKGAFAAKLIEETGLKGLRVGNAMVSEKHCGFIVNLGGATAEDVETLIEKIIKIVKIEKNVDLEKEIKIIG